MDAVFDAAAEAGVCVGFVGGMTVDTGTCCNPSLACKSGGGLPSGVVERSREEYSH